MKEGPDVRPPGIYLHEMVHARGNDGTCWDREQTPPRIRPPVFWKQSHLRCFGNEMKGRTCRKGQVHKPTKNHINSCLTCPGFIVKEIRQALLTPDRPVGPGTVGCSGEQVPYSMNMLHWCYQDVLRIPLLWPRSKQTAISLQSVWAK